MPADQQYSGVDILRDIISVAIEHLATYDTFVENTQISRHPP